MARRADRLGPAVAARLSRPSQACALPGDVYSSFYRGRCVALSAALRAVKPAGSLFFAGADSTDRPMQPAFLVPP